MNTRYETLAWRVGAIAFFVGLPILLLALIAGNLNQAAVADDLAATQQATLTQIVGKLAARRPRDLTPEDTASLYLASTSISLARAELQARVSKLTEEAGGHLAEVQLTATPEQEADGVLAIQLALVIDNKGLLDLIYAMETGLPLLTVTDLSARPNTVQGGDALRVDITVQGHFRKSTG